MQLLWHGYAMAWWDRCRRETRRRDCRRERRLRVAMSAELHVAKNIFEIGYAYDLAVARHFLFAHHLIITSRAQYNIASVVAQAIFAVRRLLA